MADPILRSKITFGTSDRVQSALDEGKIDEFDVLCLEDEDSDKMGWIDKNGVVHIIQSGMSEADVTSKVNAAVEESKAYADEKVETVVEEKLTESVDEKVSEKIDSALVAYTAEKFEIVGAPEGTLVNYGDNEIRIMVPSDAVFTKQNVGTNGDPNSFYVTLKTYFTDDEVVGYIEHLGDQVDAEILKDIQTDENGRRYQPSWLAVAKYDEVSGAWTHYGSLSSEDKYIGWDYQIDQYNANNVMIASDFVRINLTNENCHSSLVPYYVKGAVNGVVEEANAYTDAKIAEVVSGVEIVEF